MLASAGLTPVAKRIAIRVHRSARHSRHTCRTLAGSDASEFLIAVFEALKLNSPSLKASKPCPKPTTDPPRIHAWLLQSGGACASSFSRLRWYLHSSHFCLILKQAMCRGFRVLDSRVYGSSSDPAKTSGSLNEGPDDLELFSRCRLICGRGESRGWCPKMR